MRRPFAFRPRRIAALLAVFLLLLTCTSTLLGALFGGGAFRSPSAVLFSPALPLPTADELSSLSPSVVGREHLFSMQDVCPGLRVAPTPTSSEAYVTIMTHPSIKYLKGALVLGGSIRRFDASRDLVVLVTEEIPHAMRVVFECSGWVVMPVPIVPEPWFGKRVGCMPKNSDTGHRWGGMATKLRLWQLVAYR